MTDEQPKKATMRPRSAPKRYAATAGAPPVKATTAGKERKTVNVLGPVWEASADRAKELRLSVSAVVEQLLSEFNEGTFEFYESGLLVPPKPTADQARNVLHDAARKVVKKAGIEKETAAALVESLVGELAAALQQAGYLRAVLPLDRIDADLAAIRGHVEQTFVPALGWTEVPTVVHTGQAARRSADALQNAGHAVALLRDAVAGDTVRRHLAAAAGLLDDARRDAPDGVPAAADRIADRIHQAADEVAKAAKAQQRVS
ncbi:hypothetical protein AB0C76_32980 [Kitasatospora sp. NPDC048722]|uniref:hypothetical protein n=1 Tax=Kitasatospora sp. NPDC048722 TaxID=3155639 RepID=UPI0033E2ED6C